MNRRNIALAQGIYFAAAGVWPLLHMPSFEAVTGPKVDKWLVRTVGMLIGVVGGVLASAAVRDQVTAEIEALAVGSAAGLGTVAAVYAAKGRIAPIYFADAAVEAAIVGTWAVAHSRDNSASATGSSRSDLWA